MISNRFAILLFACASLGAVVVGSIVIAAGNATRGFWLRVLIAWVAGALLATAIVRLGFSTTLKLTLLLCLTGAGLLFSLINHGSMGVHRWLDLGPLHINVASLLLPALLVLLANGLGTKLATGLAAGVVVVLCLQPDASQASAFACAFVILQRPPNTRSMVQRLALAAILFCAAVSWARPNPLPAISEVEGVVGLAWHYSPVIAFVGIACLVMTAISPLLLTMSEPNIRTAGFALTTYFSLTAIAPIIGAYPVPLMGAGMSAIAGFWLGFGCLLDLHRKNLAAIYARQLVGANRASHGAAPDRMDIAIGCPGQV